MGLPGRNRASEWAVAGSIGAVAAIDRLELDGGEVRKVTCRSGTVVMAVA